MGSAFSFPFELTYFWLFFSVDMHLGRVFGVATGAYFSQGSNAGQTLNTRLPMPGQTANSCKNLVDLQPLFIVDAGGSNGPLTNILCVDLGSCTLLLNPLVSSVSKYRNNCYLVPFKSFEGVSMMNSLAV